MKKASTAPPNVSRLPWERVEGAAEDTGICLSGGGLRAASFSFGVLQALQEKRRMVFGPTSARYLAAVSGGSYIAAAYLLGAHHQARNPTEYGMIPPLAQGSPEEAHILSNGRYLAQTRLLLLFLCFTFLNFLALVVLYVWVGAILAGAVILRTVLIEWFRNGQWLGNVFAFLDRLPMCLLLSMLVVSWLSIVQGLYADGGWRRWLPPLIGMLVMVAVLPPVLQAASDRQHWWAVGNMLWVVAGIFAFLFIVAGLTLLAQRIGVIGYGAAALNTLAVWSVRSVGLTLVAWSATSWYSLLAEALRSDSIGTILTALASYFFILIALVLFSYVPHRASLHREYRNRLESCFAIRREGGTATTVARTLLTELAPLQDATARFPRLLICATANVRRGRVTFVPFIFSYDMCGVPGHPGAAFPTAKLELIQEPSGFLTRDTEPLVSLSTAVAATGAAVSPGMGRYTLPSLRLLFTAANIRLGRWFPNPFSVRIREAVYALTSPGWFDKDVARDKRSGPGYDELIPEVLGFDGPRVYMSDGGHYDNLGLLTLLRAKCAEIWCVDASPEPRGQSEELHRVLAVARGEMGIEVDIDLDRFAATPDGFYGSTHAAGEIRYPGGSNGRLIVIKLGLTRESPNLLRQRRRTDRGFPHHSTLRQVYSTDRMNAYRKLGYDSALRCLSSCTA